MNSEYQVGVEEDGNLFFDGPSFDNILLAIEYAKKNYNHATIYYYNWKIVAEWDIFKGVKIG